MKSAIKLTLALTAVAAMSSGCVAARVTGDVLEGTAKGIYYTGKTTGKVVYGTGKFAYNVTNGTLTTTEKALGVTNQAIQTADSAVDLATKLETMDVQAKVNATREAVDVLGDAANIVFR